MIRSMVRRDLRGRYKGSFLGFLWTFLNPMLQLVVYTAVFSTIIRMGIEQYYLFLFVALGRVDKSIFSAISCIIITEEAIVMKIQKRRYELTDDEWERICSLFPVRGAGTKGRPYNDIRTTVNGIIWLARSGAPWRDLPERYGKWNTVYKCFAKWQKHGIFEKIFHELRIEADLQDISIDSTSCKVHQHSAGAKKGELTVM